MAGQFLSETVRRQMVTYALTGIGLFLSFALLRESTWEGSKDLHTVMEVIATLLALMVGTLGLVRYYTKPNNTILLIGTAFLGTALLDGYHALVTSHWFDYLWPSPPPHLIPWSWNASRTFLALMMFLSWLAWRREVRLGLQGAISPKDVYFVVGLLTLGSFIFFAFVPLPRAYYPELTFGRPEEFVSAVLFLLALVGYLLKGAWKTEPFEHWVVLSLIVGFVCQAAFMSSSFHLYDTMFDIAHLLKKVSYICVLIGLLISLSLVLIQAEAGKKALVDSEARLREHRRHLEEQVAQRTAELMASNKVLHVTQDTVDNAAVPIFWIDPETAGFLYVNDRVCEVLGYSPEEMLHLRVPDIDPEFPFERWPGHVAELRSGAAQTFETVHRTKDGRVLPVEVTVYLTNFQNEERMVAFATDISKRKNAEREIIKAKDAAEAINEELRLFKLFAEESAQGIGMAKMDRKAFYYNKRLMEVLGITWKETAEVDFLEYYPDWAQKLISGEVMPSLLQKGYWTGELALTNLVTKKVTPTLESFILIKDQDDQPLYIMDMMTDISEQKHIEAELSRAKEQAEAANRAKSIFLANMSHELRTPLNAILGFSQLMARDQNIPAEHSKSLEVVKRSGQHLLSLINDVLEISKIESGRLKLTTETVDLHDLLTTLTDVMMVRAEQKGVALSFTRADKVPHFVETDPTKVRQVVTNLLSNAVKYTRQGEIRVYVEAEQRDGQDAVLIEVADTGVGIQEQDLERIFTAFYQAEYGMALGEGTGLGLAISKEYTDLLGGELSVESTHGKGSVFRFRLPVKVVEAPEEATDQYVPVIELEPGQPSYRILVAEDNKDNQLLIASLLGKVGFTVQLAENGQQAVDLVKTWKPHFIWMDMRMPVMDGYEATRRIKAMPEGAGTVIAALTASAFEEDREAVLQVGCDGFIRKPIEEAKLFAVMHELLGVRFTYEEAPPKETATIAGNLDLGKLPADLRSGLEQAALVLDVEKLKQLVEQIGALSPSHAEALRKIIHEYRFDEIVSAVRNVD